MTTAPSRRRGKIRALLSLGMLLGISQVGTLAAWTDSATVSGGGFSSGTLDVAVGDAAADQLTGPGGSWTHASLSLDGALPGESVARTVTVGNAGSVPLALDASATIPDGALASTDGSGLLLTVSVGGEPVNTGTAATGDRHGVCSGGVSVLVDAPLSSAETSLGIDGVRLSPEEETSLCVSIGLSPAAPNSMQGASTTVAISVEAKQ
ncbi:SipW-dependent-type signal peptide-containing protein [Paramicrobacterium chengjingii]|uniref:SipW-cognate class signal peptide n=1 Tax=Paramicrobacterium chengjingii TaxID=2769067 RepID=A0ABX6YFW7_9MICO|nr:SipW-dependent-type signal peptide-containing protein [Microbacterium chengjingii]QPZ37671.1 hypothetical protein HCR76_12675 [Microbacterium chengjingii]